MSVTKELPELQIFKTVLFHCLVIIALPVLSFFTSKMFVFDGMEAKLSVVDIFSKYLGILCSSTFVVSLSASSSYLLCLLGLNNIPSNVYSAGVAILVLHVALAAFIYRAYFDDQSKTQAKQD